MFYPAPTNKSKEAPHTAVPFPLAKTIKRLDYLPKLLLLLTISNAMPTAAQATAIAGHKMTVAVSPVWGVLEPASETALSSS